jgi:hypothetical protein
VVKIWETTVKYSNRLARPSWDVVNPSSLDKLRKEAVVPKEFEHLRRTGRSRRSVGPLLWTDMANRGFLSY